MKSKLFIVVICLMFLASGAGGFIAYRAINGDEDEVRVEVGDGTTERLIEVKDLNLYPGKEKTCKIKFLSADGGANVTLSFETVEDGELKKYVDVYVTVGETTTPYKLADLLDGEQLSFSGVTDTIVLTYKMDEGVGNEAQGAKVLFNVLVKAESEITE